MRIQTEPKFTEHGCDGSLDIVVIPVVLVSPELLLVCTKWVSEDDSLNFLSKKWTFWGHENFWGTIFTEYHH